MKIAVLLSGGVDSSVALKLLKEQGHDLTAFYIKIWLEDEFAYLGDCPWQEDLKYAKKVCKQINVPLKIISLQKEYWSKIVSFSMSQIKEGKTPSPDIFCNKFIKFGCFFEKISSEFEIVATGHYAILNKNEDKIILKKAKDLVKDQTYFLSHLSQEQLKKILFPLGNFNKSETRLLAKEYNLPNKIRKDSQGICFLGKIKFSDFIRHHFGIKKGDLIEFETGKKIGEHDGFWYYTIGQRKKIGLSGGPWYVVKKDTVKNIVYISCNYFTSEKKRDKFIVSDFNWIFGYKPEKIQLDVKIRHGKEFYKCDLNFLNDNKAIVSLYGRDQGIAQGQYAVFYDEDVCLGCGLIN